MPFDDIIGNVRVKNILRRSLLRGRVPGSLLFYGPKGVGKSEMALIFAKALNCLNRDDDSCEDCSSCSAVNKNVFPDVLRINAEKDIIRIDQIRLMKRAAYLRPMTGKKRVFIIEEAEKMNDEASNSLLKVLEEPPVFSHIILTTDNFFSILPTVRSRCQTLKFAPVSRNDIQKALIEKRIEEGKAKTISLLVKGSLKQALEFDWDEAEDKRKKAFNMFSSFVKGGERANIFKKYSRMQKKNFEENINPVLEVLASFCRDMIVMKMGSDDRFLINLDYKHKLSELEEILDLKQTYGFLGVIEESLRLFQQNANRRAIMNSMAINLMDMDKENV